ncbi:MAG: DUF4258 domain-containing protein [Candidatus Woesearchaeota archaeon]
MKIAFTVHTQFRLKKRKIQKGEVIDAVKYPDAILKRHGKYFFRKKLRRGTIEVCCERTERHIKVITVYWI